MPEALRGLIEWVGSNPGKVIPACLLLLALGYTSGGWFAAAEEAHQKARQIPEIIKAIDGLTRQHEQEEREKAATEKGAKDAIRELCIRGTLKDAQACLKVGVILQ